MDLEAGSKYLFDTTVFIDVLRRHDRARKLYFQGRFYPVSVGYSIITETELWAGISEDKFRTVSEHTILLKPFQRYFINVTIARRAGELKRILRQADNSKTPGLPDCIIAATAEYHGLVVCSKNSKDFAKFRQFAISVLEYH